MPDVWVAAAIAAAVVAVAGVGVLTFRPRTAPVTFANAREERLARRLAQKVGCDLADALPAVREELRIAPGQSDETLLKRATYHYQQNLPEKQCGVWRDRAPG